jgi:hypothetical protein
MSAASTDQARRIPCTETPYPLVRTFVLQA